MPLVILVLLAATIFGMNHLVTRYKHTSRSRRVFAAVGVLALVIPFAFIYVHFRTLELSLVIAGTFGFGLPTYTLLAVVVAEIWRKVKQRSFDAALADRTQRRSELQERLFALDQRTEMVQYRRAETESAAPEAVERQRELRARLAAWQREGALARIRTLKVTEWQDEYARLTAEELSARRQDMRAQIAGERDPDRVSHLEAQVAVVELELLSRTGRAPGGELHALDKNEHDLREERRAVERDLARVKEEIEEWADRRRHFLSQRVILE
jgi:hypothetical protein